MNKEFELFFFYFSLIILFSENKSFTYLELVFFESFLAKFLFVSILSHNW